MLFSIFKELGFGYQEKYYQRAFEELLIKNKLAYKRELYCPIKFNEKIIGKYYLDFLIENKIIVELKISNEMYQKHFQQVYGYLKLNNIKVGLLALITPKKIKINRIVN